MFSAFPSPVKNILVSGLEKSHAHRFNVGIEYSPILIYSGK